jgi:hypothetical protein
MLNRGQFKTTSKDVEEREWGTAKEFPVGSRTTVQVPTWTCLTSVFGMRTGDPGHFGRPPTNLRVGLLVESFEFIHTQFNERKLEGINIPRYTPFKGVNVDVS